MQENYKNNNQNLEKLWLVTVVTNNFDIKTVLIPMYMYSE